jgi:hypothetical protein
LRPESRTPWRQRVFQLESSHADAFQGTVGIDPGDAGEWFREFQISGVTKEDVRHTMRLMLRREGTSVAFTTRYQPSGKQVPFEYYAVGLCKADFVLPATAEERGR